MEDSYPNWNSLPTEILQDIIQLAAEHEQTATKSNLTLVCKTWLHSAQFVMYSCISINNLSQLKKFYGTVESNSSLGEMVKVFCIHKLSSFSMTTASRVEAIDIVTNLLSTCLPNVEIIDGRELSSYTPVLSALRNSQLRRLRKLPTAYSNDTEKDEVNNYIDCALNLKSRLENVIILNDVNEQTSFHRLYNELHQFHNLTEIRIERETMEDIQALEYVIENCQLLQKITFNFIPLNNDNADLPVQNNNVSMDDISHFVPRPNIKIIDGDLYVSNNYKNLAYIMHKFPNLCELDLGIVESNHIGIDQHLLTQLLYYLSQIDCCSVRHVNVDPAIGIETIGRYWTATSRTNSEFFKITYSIWSGETENKCWFARANNSRGFFTGLTYTLLDPENIEWTHMDFVESNGMHIRELLFTLNTTYFHLPDTWESPGHFVAHTMSFCPNIQYLYFTKSVLKRSLCTTIDSSKKLSLVELYIYDCEVNAGMFEQLSLILREIKQLRLGAIWNCFNDGLSLRFAGFDVNMSHTAIDCIIFEYASFYRGLYLKVSVLNHESQYCYRLGSTGNRFEELDEQEYVAGVINDKQVHISCARKPTLLIEREKYFFL